MDSNRAPSTELKTVITDKIRNKISAGQVISRESKATAITISIEVTTPPYSPSTDLFGLTFGASFFLPNLRPTKYAPLSAPHTSKNRYITHHGELCQTEKIAVTAAEISTTPMPFRLALYQPSYSG